MIFEVFCLLLFLSNNVLLIPEYCHFHPFAGQAPIVQKMDSTIQWISIRKTNCAVRWIEIYPMDNTYIHPLNNRGLRTLRDKTDNITGVLACMQMSEKSPTYFVPFLHVIKKWEMSAHRLLRYYTEESCFLELPNNLNQPGLPLLSLTLELYPLSKTLGNSSHFPLIVHVF